MVKILVVDDEQSILETLCMFLEEKGLIVFTAGTGEKGLELFDRERPQIVILDIRLPDANGLDLLTSMGERPFFSKIIMITAFQDMETTIQAMKRGAFDYIHKPLDIDQVEQAVDRAARILRIDRETPSLARAGDPLNSQVIVGRSEKMRQVFKMMGLVCTKQVNVLLQGDTGTGKELTARVIHSNSPNAKDPFIVFDCSAVVENIIESELFGHTKGAFTGADQTTRGKIELAGNGTLFLDEIAQLPLKTQGKLLGFIQRREFLRVGGTRMIESNCRIVAACNQDLAQMVDKGLFKEDLYYRLKVFTIRLPSLKERISDLPFLVEHFLNKINGELGTHVTKIQDGVMERLSCHNWKGNVRELENIIVQALVGCRGNVLLKDDIHKLLNEHRSEPAPGLASYSLSRVEKNHISQALSQLAWNKSRTARLLGISLPTLRSKIKKYNIQPG
ncbi:sigma-54-dependent transcriptional regulator [Desulfospira joergensenii]|uniref:sigma-54-dependent transcriptional regulator n=1 Tax=Desulfospira joergensenii TaxID=53329 RepID=UPI0003B4B017|nr:sigma-54 dependent transcriptional regulator [Desulfospira joergensenii]